MVLCIIQKCQRLLVYKFEYSPLDIIKIYKKKKKKTQKTQRKIYLVLYIYKRQLDM